MKVKGPLLTLLVGLATALALLAASMNATSKQAARRKAGVAPAATAATTPAGLPTSAAPTSTAAASTPPDQAGATYAGRVNGASATIAIAVHDGTAIAYLCDGRQTEAWLRGSASGGQLTLTGPANASLSGSYGGGRAGGSVMAASKQWTFDVPVATPPSGLYRAAATVTDAKIVGGWIVLADGTQVGVLTAAGRPGPAPPLDPATGGAVVNGTPVTATPINGATGSGF